jgi:ankyrin repeat protein
VLNFFLKSIFKLIHVNPGCRTATDKHDTLPLHCAICNGNMSAIQFLLQKEQKKQLCAKDADGNTPLHLAAQKGILLNLRLIVRKIKICVNSLIQILIT